MRARLLPCSFALWISFSLGIATQAQRATPPPHWTLQVDSLVQFSRNITFLEEAPDRLRNDSLFVRTLVRALKTPYSYYWPLDSVNISTLYPPDSTFRLFTWQVKKDEYFVLQKGAIQMNTRDGSLKLYPLFDYSMYTAQPGDSVRDRQHWIGAIYYAIRQTQYEGQTYYTLFGFDEFTVNANRKWMEVLHFTADGEPVFGGPFFSFAQDSIKKPVLNRFYLEYKKEAKAVLKYDPELDLVIVDHLISETDEPEKKFTLVPDGDYEAFRWQNGQWVHIEKLFTQQSRDGEFPREAPLLDASGNADEKKLWEVSEKNAEKEKAVRNPPPKRTPAPKKEKQ